ncbi:transcriptional regulator [Bradyrhizobium sp. LCT2]|uniref:ATP-binding protein n=1 Tax=Bradyrhizobium sp. LCT2 TaxID=2493093 RepID=UPI0013739943|nr:winged helix-turn-helix domain-containing protein [Bradyrhizobium sp. LCT2]QHP69892.1 transcriptional regulator [Bradyrhizobium sp. LCT2]
MTTHGKEVLSFGPFRLTASERLLTKDGVPVDLGARAYEILTALVSTPNEVISKKDLLSLVWPNVTVEEGSLRGQMASLRKMLGDGKDGARYITTVAGRGYCFVAPVSRSLGEPEAASAAAESFRNANLPVRPAGLIDREDDLQRVAAQLEVARFVTVVGLGGVGKTTLATALGHHLIEAFGGAVLFVDLSMLSDSRLVTSTVASMLGLSVRSDDATPNLIAYLRDKRVLLILDTCEHLIESVATFASCVFRETPQVHILATSREALQVDGEQIYRLEPLACPPDDAMPTAAIARSFPATQLFVERAAASGARLDLDDADAPIVVGICRKLDGVALAIELAARRVEAYGLRDTAALLDQRLTLLWLGSRTAPPRHKTLQATLDWSYRLLSSVERLVLRRLAVFVGHFTLDAMLAVVTSVNLDQTAVLGAIDSLIAKSMVTTRPIGAMMRYRLLDTTRTYILGTEITDPEAADLAVRHANYFRRWSEQAGREWAALSSGAEREAHLADLNNVRAALEWCFGEGGDPEIGIKLAAAAAPVLLAMSLLSECYRWSQHAIVALEGRTRGEPEEMQLQANLGVASMHMNGPSDAARAALDRSLAIAEAGGNVLSQVGILGTLSMFCTRDGEFKTALDHARRARTVAGAAEDPHAMALAQSAVGRALHFIGEHCSARSELEAALQHWSHAQRAYLGFDDRILVGLGLARGLWVQGHPTKAAVRARETIKDAESSTNPASLAVALAWAPDVFVWNGDLASAEAHADRLVAHARSHSLGPYLHVGYGYKGILAIRRGDARGGVDTLRGCLKHCHAMHYEVRNTEFNILLAQGLLAIEQVGEAIRLVDDTISRAEENGDLFFMPEALRVRGRAVLAMPTRVDDAERWFKQSLELSRRQGAHAWELRTAIDLAALLAGRGQPDDACGLLRPVFEQFTEGLETADLAAAGRLLASLAGRTNS